MNSGDEQAVLPNTLPAVADSSLSGATLPAPVSEHAHGPERTPTNVPETAPRAMPVWRDAIFRRLLAIADLLAATGGLTVIAQLTGRGMPAASVATIPLIVLVSKLMGRYDHDEVVLRKSTLDEIPALLALAGAYTLTWSFVAFLAGVHMNLRGGGVFLLWFSTALLLILTRAVARGFAQWAAPLERVLIVGDAAASARLAHSLASDPSAKIEVAGMLPLEDKAPLATDGTTRTADGSSFEDLGALVADLDVHRVFLVPTSADSETMLDAVKHTMDVGVKVSIVPRLFEVVGSAVEFDTVGGVTVLGVRRAGLSRSSSALKRTTDLVGAGVGLFVLSPVLAIVALAIKLDTRGPVFFRQWRVGRDGQPFPMVKFRSMVDGAEAQRSALESMNESHGIFKLAADPRITQVGRLLRRSSLDELPQLVNVLRGEMSLVGPRPLVAAEDRLVEGRHRARLQLAPGMTGPWQVLGPVRPPLNEMVKTDYLYAANWSLWTDVKIILRTVAHAFARRGV